MTTALPTAFSDFDQEFAATRRMLAAFPDAHAEWRPHERSRTLAALAAHVATLPMRGTQILTTDSLDTAGRRAPAPIATRAELVATLDTSVAAFRAALGAADDAALEQPWALRAGDKVLVSAPRRAQLRWIAMSHLIHHRAQLGLYYRLLDVPVPGMYGPSADDAARP